MYIVNTNLLYILPSTPKSRVPYIIIAYTSYYVVRIKSKLTSLVHALMLPNSSLIIAYREATPCIGNLDYIMQVK